MAQDFSTGRVNKKWVGEITYFATNERWLYFCVVLDLSSGGVGGYAMSKIIDTALVSNAVRVALKQLGYPRDVLFHSDRVSQYASDAILNLLAGNGMQASMSRRGRCWDNAVCESFFSTLKREMNASAGFRSYR